MDRMFPFGFGQRRERVVVTWGPREKVAEKLANWWSAESVRPHLIRRSRWYILSPASAYSTYRISRGVNQFRL